MLTIADYGKVLPISTAALHDIFAKFTENVKFDDVEIHP